MAHLSPTQSDRPRGKEGRGLAVGCHNKANRKWNRIKCIIRFWPGWPRASIRVVREGEVQLERERAKGRERKRFTVRKCNLQ